MMIAIRKYQQETIDAIYRWWIAHPKGAPIVSLPTGSGKSIIIAELVRLLWDTWPDESPRCLVVVPGRELAEQNADKLVRLLPNHIHVDYYSASLGRKRPDADVIVATIGSVHKAAHLLGNIKCVIVDEAHLTNPDGAGMYRQLVTDLARYCAFRVVGLTATPFRGNGVWLTSGKDPLFSGIACEVSVKELLDAGHLAPLVRPIDAVQTQIDVAGISTATGDYNVGELAERVLEYLPGAADEACTLAVDRRKWLAFLPTVANANAFSDLLNDRGILSAVVCGETPKSEREQLIAAYRAGKLRCLVTVLALATGFDVPDVDCILWLRPTVSPVLYVQGAGRGLRPAAGKSDCLWLDFSDTTERMGPVDAIRGRNKIQRREAFDAPFAICNACGAQVRPASALVCPECGEHLREDEEKAHRGASNAAVMAHQVAAKIVTYPVDTVRYYVHRKDGSPDSLRVEYWSGLRAVAKEWVCVAHPPGFARSKAAAWWSRRSSAPTPHTASDAVAVAGALLTPAAIVVNESGKWPEIVRMEWRSHDEGAVEGHGRGCGGMLPQAVCDQASV